MYKWIRPSTVKHPTIWKTFTGKNNTGTKKYWIQDITNEYKQQIIKFSVHTFLKDEPVTNLLDVPLEIREKEFTKIWENILNQRMVLICLSENNGSEPVICGVNYTLVLSKYEKVYSSTDVNFERFLMVLDFIQENGKLFEKFGIDKYLYSFGLYVSPEYRGQNIGANLLEARDGLCKAFGLKATAAIFGSKYSQRAAEIAGFQNLFTLYYNDFLKKLNSKCYNILNSLLALKAYW
ncbi:hypothetical protein Trydic_g22692 [Trypoxylus dichotomus]